MSPKTLGVDIGTSGARAALLDETGAVAAVAATRFAEVGGDAKAPATWRCAMQATLNDLAARADLSSVASLAVDGTSGTMLALDADNEPIGLAIMYDEPCRDAALLERIAAAAPKGSAALGASSALARALALQLIPGAKRVLHQADWIAGLLSGRFDCSDENNALKTGYDVFARSWPNWIQEAGANVERLPKILPPGTPIGAASVFAQSVGLPATAIICAGTTDGCASFLATGAERNGDAVTALGSTLVIKLLSPKPIENAEYGIYSHRLGERWLVGGASNSGGKAIEALFPGEDLAELTKGVRPDEPTGLDYYPLARPGERFPINDAALAPRLEPRPVERARFFQGVLEGIAAIEALGYARLVELGAPALRSLRTVGGGAANAAWTEIRRRRIDAPFIPPFSHEACVGAARLARLGGENA